MSCAHIVALLSLAGLLRLAKLLCVSMLAVLSWPTSAANPQAAFSRLIALSGDRQISVNSRFPAQPYRVQALDAQGAPVQGADLVIGPTGYGGPWRLDEFGYLGFNRSGVMSYCSFGCPHPAYYFLTGADGVASGTGEYTDVAPAAYLYGAAWASYPFYGPQVFFTVVAVKRTPPGTPSVVVEYFHTARGHYFNTHLENEIRALDDSQLTGWSRSIGAFIAYANRADAPVGAVPVCRYFSSQFVSHFYSASVEECEAVRAQWPDVWTFETSEAFWILEPDKATGQCGLMHIPVYRLVTARNGSNHRYVTDASLRDRMVGAGWVSEGYGPKGVVFCTPE